jgi:hypothetical protein
MAIIKKDTLQILIVPILQELLSKLFITISINI